MRNFLKEIDLHVFYLLSVEFAVNDNVKWKIGI